MAYGNTLSMAAWVIFGMAIVEASIAFSRGRRRNLEETVANLAIYGVRRGILTFFQKGFQLLALNFFFGLTPFRVEITPLSFLGLLILVDFIYWGKHALEHKTRLLWSMHCVHHSSSEFNLSTALRLPWLGHMVLWVFYLPPVLFGFSPIATLVCVQLVLLYQFWIHSEAIPKLGFLEKIFNTASHHRVHHASNYRYLDKNFGGILIIWDRLFGTFAEEREPVRYGLTKPIQTSNPFRIVFEEPIKLIKDIIASRSIVEAVRICCKGPDYQPQSRRRNPT